METSLVADLVLILLFWWDESLVDSDAGHLRNPRHAAQYMYYKIQGDTL